MRRRTPRDGTTHFNRAARGQIAVKSLNGLIIGGCIIVSALIIVHFLPRYQYVQVVTVNEQDGVVSETTTAYVFDMVTSKKYTRGNVLTYAKNAPDSRVKPISTSWVGQEPKHSWLEFWEKQREVFGEKDFTGEEWNSWMRMHKW